jgi:hypothetical protein
VLHFPKFRVVKTTISLKFNKFSEILNAAATCGTSKKTNSAGLRHACLSFPEQIEWFLSD